LQLYRAQGISKERVLIKIVSTWEGIKAAEILQSKYGVNINLTLMFSQVQAIAAAEAGIYLISPFVGRILDWYKASTKKGYNKKDDPGVESVCKIYNYYKRFGYKTIVMGASFRTIDEITELAGCDYLTIAVSLHLALITEIHSPSTKPSLLEQLYNATDSVSKKLDVSSAKALDIERKTYINDESAFRFHFNEDQMAVEKLREGISKFTADAVALKNILRHRIEASKEEVRSDFYAKD
jgi:transaldolase